MIIRPGWTIVHFDLAEPIEIQLERAKKRLQEVQEDFLKRLILSIALNKSPPGDGAKTCGLCTSGC